MAERGFTTPAAAKELGITSDQFLRLAKARDLEPVGSHTNPGDRYVPECALWSAKDLGRLKRTNDLKAMAKKEKDNESAAAGQAVPEDTSKTSAVDIYLGSHGGRTRSYLSKLEKLGWEGKVAAQVFRAQKASSRAKAYKGGLTNVSYSDLAYDAKAKAISRLCELLAEDPTRMTWGWKEDPSEDYAPWVLYVELPNGQVSFHSRERMTGPNFVGKWDEAYDSDLRILQFCDNAFGYDGPVRDFVPPSRRTKWQKIEEEQRQKEKERWQKLQERQQRIAESELNADRLMELAESIASEVDLPKFSNSLCERLVRIIEDGMGDGATEVDVLASIRREIVRTLDLQKKNRVRPRKRKKQKSSVT
jgi:hypothetical protein